MWKVLSSKYLLKDRWIAVRSEACVDEKARLVEPYYTFEYPDFVHVLAITPDDQVVLVRQYRHGLGQDILELPGGMQDPEDRTPLAAGLRELEEETGYVSSRSEVIGSYSVDPAKFRNRLHLVLAREAASTGRVRQDPTESIDVVLMPIGDLVQRIRSGQFPNAAHAGLVFCGLLHLARTDPRLARLAGLC